MTDLSSTLYPNERATLAASEREPSGFVGLDLIASEASFIELDASGNPVFALRVAVPAGTLEGFGAAVRLVGADGASHHPNIDKELVFRPKVRFVLPEKRLTEEAKAKFLQILEMQRARAMAQSQTPG